MEIEMLYFLLLQCDPKDQNKIEYIYYHFHDDLVKLAKKKLRYGNGDGKGKRFEKDAEDVVQNLYMRLTEYAYRIDMGWTEERMESYIKASLNNAIIDYFKMMKKFPEFAELKESELAEIDEADFLARLNLETRKEDVIEAIMQLQPIYRSIFEYKYLEEMGNNEIAELMGVPIKTVYNRVERGKKMLLAALEEGDQYGNE